MRHRGRAVLPVLGVVALLVAGACSGKKAGTTGLAARATTTTGSTAPTDTVASGEPSAGATTTVVKVTTTVTTVAGGRATATTATTAAPARPTTTVAVATTTANATTQTVHATGPPDYGFSPATFSVAAGSKVVVVNDSQAAPHTWTADDGSFDTGTIATGASSAPITLTKKGTFGFYCKIHGATLMHGTVTVT